MSPRSKGNQHLVSSQLLKTRAVNLSLRYGLGYWSTETLCWQASIDPSPKCRRPREDWKLGYSWHQESQRNFRTDRFPPFQFFHIKMPHNCCVPFCNVTSKKNKNLRFPRFPKKRELKDQWIAKIRRDEGDYFAVTENRRVCSKHLCEEDFKGSEDGKGRKLFRRKVLFQLFLNGPVKNDLGVLL